MSPPAAPATRVASAAPNAPSDGFFSNLARKVGLSGAAAETTATAQPIAAKPKVVEAKRSDPARPDASSPKASKPEPKQAARPQPKPSAADTASAPAARDGLVDGAQPIVSANSFESRFSATK
jgi:hypothetical protein